jgi:phosphatidylinositol alpha-1,6-mannosyltransferase
LIDAWTAVLARVPGATLVIVGDGTDRRRLQARAAVFGDRVIFTGFIGRVSLESWYARAAAFALPSRGEGFGVVYLEAMSYGVPCVGSLQDAARDVIRDGETGFLVDQSDRDALSGALVRVLEDRDLAARMGAAGRRSVLEGFTFDHFVRRFAALAHAGLERRERPALHGDRSA